MGRRSAGNLLIEVGVASVVLMIFFAVYKPSSQGGSCSCEGFETPQYAGIDYERLFAIVTAFRRVLERPPTEEELQKYRNKLSLDPEFDVPALETELRQSAEYKRLVGAQKNSNLAAIDGVVSEAAIRGKLRDMYFRIAGQNPDDVTMDLLYSRYRHTNLSDAYITALIQQMVNVDGKRATGSSKPSGSDGVASSAASVTATHGSAAGNEDSISIEKAWLRSLGLTEEDLRGSPGDILAKLKNLARTCRQSDIDKDRYHKKQICLRDKLRTLDSINYDVGEPMGSWTMPINRDQRVLHNERQDYSRLKASNAQTALIGTLLTDINNSSQ